MKFYIVTVKKTPTCWLSYGETQKIALGRVFLDPSFGRGAKATELNLDSSQTRLLVHALELGGEKLLRDTWELIRELAMTAERANANLAWMGHNGI